MGFYQSCQLECTKCSIALVARAYPSYSIEHFSFHALYMSSVGYRAI